jgi:PPM family protein phosphatase
MTRICIKACTDIGARKENEDAFRIGFGPNGPYALLADGAGGHSRGQEASQRAVDCIERVIGDPGVAFSPANLTQIVRLAHSELQHHQGSERHEVRMHTTVVALWVSPDGDHVLWTHVGDSRLYRVRANRVELLTQDDSVVQQMVLAGVMSPEQSRHHPQKNQLLAALGMSGDVEPHTVVRPVELLEGDAFLLCTDGWWDALSEAEIADTLSRAIAPDDWLTDMQARVRAQNRPHQDNFSAIAAWVGNPAETTVGRSDDTVPRARHR